MNWIFRLLLMIPFVASAQVEVRRYATMADLLTANPSSFAVAGRATVVVTGRTNLYDGWSRVLAYSASDTNAANNQTIFSPANTNFPGRYRLLYLENATNSAIRAGILPAYGANSFWYNGAWTPVSNIFVAGANSTVSVATNGVVTIASASGGEIILPVDAARITNGILSSSQAKGSDISWSVEAGTNVVATIYNGTVTFQKIQGVSPSTLLGGTEGGAFIRDVDEIQIGANLQMIGNTLSAIVPASTNSWQIEVGGVLTIEPDLVDTGRIDVSASGSSVSFDLVSGSVSTNYLSAGVNSLLHAHNLAFTVNGTTVIDPNVSSSEEIAAAVASSTNVYFALNPGSVALSKLTNMVASRLLGRGSSGLGAVEPITVGTGLVLGTNGVLSATGTNATVVRVGGTTVTNPNFLDTSEVDMSIDLATNISASLFNNSVVFSKLQQIGTSRLLGRSTAGSGDIEQILIGSGLSLTSGTLSATGGGGGTSVYVDGVSVSGPNFSDASTTGLFDVSGTNVTIRLPDRDFGDISVGSSGASMTIDADSVALGTDTTGNYVATVSGTANEVSVSGSGSETAAVTLSLPATIDLGGKTSFEVPNSTGPTTDAVGEIAVDSNAWATGRGALQIFDGTANTFAVGVLASDTPTNGQVPKWNTGGTITWEDDNTGTNGVQTTTSDVVKLMGYAYFTITNNSTVGDFSFESIGGVISDINCTQCDNDRVGKIDFTFSTLATNYFWTLTREGDSSVATPIGSHAWEDTGLRTATSLRLFMMDDGGSVTFADVAGYMFRFNLYSTVTVGGSGGSGTVTNVAMSTSLSGLSVSGSPITSGGTLTLSGTLGEASIDAALPRLANAQTFTGSSNIFTGDLYVGGTLNVSTQIVDLLVATQIDLGTNIVAVVNGGTGATNAAGARTALALVPGTNVEAWDADLDAFAAGTVIATAQTNAVSWGAPVLYAGSTNVPAAIALKAPLASPALTGDPTAPTAASTDNDTSIATTAYVTSRIDDTAYNATSWNGDTNAPTKNAVRDKIESMSSGSGDVSSTGNNTLSGTNTFSGPTWIKPNRKRVVLFEKDWMALTSGNAGYPEFNGTAVASGTSTIIAGETNHPGMMRITSSSSANSGYYYVSSTSGLFAEPLLTWESISRVRGTNAGISSTHGFTDSVNSSNPTDAIRMWRSNNFLIPQIWNNGSLVQGYEYPVSSNQVLYIKVQVQTNMTDVSFYAEDSDTKTLILSTNITGTIPASSSRVFGMGHFAFFTNAVAISIEDLDWSTAYIDTPVNR